MSKTFLLRLRLALVHGTTSFVLEDTVTGNTLEAVEERARLRFDDLLDLLTAACVRWREPGA